MKQRLRYAVLMIALPAMLLLSMLSAAQPVQVHGHRGARALRPENTLPAFEYAINAGVDVLELDLAVTKDNILVVSHDPHMNPKICTGPAGSPTIIREMTLAQLRKWDCGGKQNPEFSTQQPVPHTPVPALEEVLTLSSRGRFHFNIETKISPAKPELTPSPEEFSRLLADALRKHNLVSRTIVQSFDFRTLHAMKKLLPDVRLSALYMGPPKDFTAIAREAGASIISPHFTLVTPQQVMSAHAAGLQVVPWTANTKAQWDKLIDAQVDAIITDDPAALITYLRSRGLRGPAAAN